MTHTMPDHAPAAVLGEVRWAGCPLCAACAGQPCQAAPAADHLMRWIAAYRAGRVTRGQLAAVLAAVVIITRRQLVPATAVTA